ncbi:trypsin-like peptidase domain-containing protein [Actinosynnema sp. NPDC020468]|uniref:WD40 domain-containing protein n=1 Tax=Actinosynnema sp. NPDC020468 TaxID=3154488 RepID=UPI00340AE9A2
MPDGSLPPSVVRLVTTDGHTAGTGVLVGSAQVLTCAHVVNLALGLDHRSVDRPTTPIRVEFPLSGDARLASVTQWTPPPPREGAPGDDIAGLVLADPVTAEPARLVTTPPSIGQEVHAFGYPEGHEDGAWVRAVVRGEVGNRLLQLDSDSAVPVQRGFSGGAVWDRELGRVVGIVATAGKTGDGYAIGADRLRLAWPEVLAPRMLLDRTAVTVLHLATLRLPPLGDVWPDLVVLSGNLTAGARPSEFARAFDRLRHLAETLELTRDRIVVVPGARDVNVDLCRAYFAEVEALEQRPVAPYWPKWRPFAAAFEAFYGKRVAFTPDEPWSLFEVPDLKVVVAGLNSTFDDTHSRPGAGFGSAQVDWFTRRMEDYLDRGWQRWGAAHRWEDSPMGLNVVFAGTPSRGRFVAHGPAHHRLVDFASPGADPAVREYVDGRWVDRPGLVIRNFRPTSAFSDAGRDTFFDHVLEATRVKHPTATVVPRPEQSYLRVSEPHPGGVTQWPVGVSSLPPTSGSVAEFVTRVHDRFAAADSTVPSVLVHNGRPASPDLVVAARRSGVRLRSFVEYQGMLDLRPLADRQASRLLADVVYPAELYVPQRFTTTGGSEVQDGLLPRVVDWLGQENARFVVVLGDFGRGKSFLLRQLTRVLPDEQAGLLPVLVELRSLEKAPSLDELLAQHLTREGVEDINLPKLRYMISSGRLALLFDGFDELELRVGYENAADYLKTLMQAVTDRAKVVLTSRTQHFRSTDQVLTALGHQVSMLTASRVVALEDFTDDQIIDFLTRHYQGDVERASARFALLGAISDLLGLSRNPRMLSFIADLDEDRLREIEQENGRISAAELYRELVEFWLVHEANRQSHRMGVTSLDRSERLDACVALALKLWHSKATTIPATDLTETAASTLSRLAERGYSSAEAAHAVGSGTLLVRNDDGSFGFVHQSVMEWLVAKVAAADPDAPDGPLALRRMSRLMVDFFCDMTGHDEVTNWARRVLAAPVAAEYLKENATLVVERLGVSADIVLRGVDTRGMFIKWAAHVSAQVAGSNFTDQRLEDFDMAGSDLSGAIMDGVLIERGDLTGANLTGSSWKRAALLGVVGADQPELAEAAVVGRDPSRPFLLPDRTAIVGKDYSEALDLSAFARRGSVVLGAFHLPSRVIRGHRKPITDVAFSPDGALLATASEDCTVCLWRTNSGKLARRLKGHLGAVHSVAFVPDGSMIASGSADATVRLWDVVTGRAKLVLRGHAGAVASIDVSPSENNLVSGSFDKTAIVWDISEGSAVSRLEGHTSEVFEVGYSTDGQTITTRSGDRTVRTWTTSGTELTVYEAREERNPPELERFPRCTVVSPDPSGLTVVTNGQSWNTDNGGLEGHLVDGVGALAHSTATGRIAVGKVDGSIFFAQGDGGSVLMGSDSPATRLTFSPDGSRLAAVNRNGGAQMWDVESRELVRSWPSPEFQLRSIAVSTGGILVATGTTYGGIQLWGRDEPIDRLLHFGSVEAMAFTRDGTQVLSGGGDRAARLWDLAEDTQVVFTGHTERVAGVAFSPSETRLATASDDWTARLWRPDGRQITVLNGHEGAVTQVVFSHGGARVATASEDGTVKVWNSNSGDLIVTLADWGEGRVKLFPDGSYQLWGEAGDHLWWAVKLCRFSPGEIDGYDPAVRRWV